MKIELKAVKYFSTMSEETNCYQANLYVNGQKIGVVSNRGIGGCDEFHGDYQKYQEANDWCTDLEVLCGDLLEEHLLLKDYKRLIKRKALYKTDEGLFQMSYGKSVAPDKALFDEVRKRYPGAIVLNELPEAEALKIFK